MNEQIKLSDTFILIKRFWRAAQHNDNHNRIKPSLLAT